jgi:hypothetical protein
VKFKKGDEVVVISVKNYPKEVGWRGSFLSYNVDDRVAVSIHTGPTTNHTSQLPVTLNYYEEDIELASVVESPLYKALT